MDVMGEDQRINLVQVYSDGSATTADKPGGYAYVIVTDGVVLESGSGGIPSSTNNVAELTAALSGLERVKELGLKYKTLELVSDSMLVLNYTNGNWKCKKMHLAMLHAKLRKLHEELKVNTMWVKGHSGNEHNETCDQLAKAERDKLMLPSGIPQNVNNNV